jgi:hypothetical protein
VLGHRGRRWSVALSFLYIGFVRLLQLFRLSRAGQQDLAIEAVMLRHEVAILRRPGRSSRPAAIGPSGPGGVEPAALDGSPGTFLRPARDPPAMAPGPGATALGLLASDVARRFPNDSFGTSSANSEQSETVLSHFSQ